MRKIGFISFLFALTFAVFIAPAQAASDKFRDVTSGNAHYMGIYTLASEGVINGYPAKNGAYDFKPFQSITRSQTSSLFVKALKLPASKNPAATLKHFKDVNEKHWYAKEIAAIYEAGIFKGSNGYFMDQKPLTREQMASVLVKAYGLKDNGKKITAKLGNVDPAHRGNVKILVQHGITNEVNDFRPIESVTRGQFATFLYRTTQQKDDQYKEMSVHYMDVGQGDGILIRTPTGKNILIDAGRKSAGQKVVDYLVKSGVKSIDLLVATHPDADHIGGLTDVLRQVPVKKVLDSGKTHTSQTYMEYLSLIDQKNIPITVPKAGDMISLDKDVKIQVLNSTHASNDNNDSSIVLKLTDGKVKYLFTGDATALNEKEMISKFDVRAQILKVGHHGSNTSTTQAFVNAVKPEVGILSYGKNNYGHPDPGVVNRLKKAGTTLYSTMQSKDIEVVSNGVVYKVNAKQWTGAPTVPNPAPNPVPNPKPNPTPNPTPNPDQPVKYPININKAGYEDLQHITGVGPVISQRIIDYRKAHGPFKKKSELMNVKGIGPVTYKKMEKQIAI